MRIINNNLEAKGLKITRQLGYFSEFDVTVFSFSKTIPTIGKLDRDHIPALATIRDYFKQNFSLQMKVNEDNLRRNTTIVGLDLAYHKQGRTYKGKNGVKLRELDAKDLKIATIKDLATHLYVFSQSRPYIIPDFIKSSIILYQRNKELCLYRN